MILPTKLAPKALEAGARAYCDFLGLDPEEYVRVPSPVKDGMRLAVACSAPRWQAVQDKISEAWALQYALSAAYDVVYPPEGGKKW